MKKLLCFLICIPFLFSCKKDDNNDPETNDRRIKEIIVTEQSNSDSLKIIFNYNENKVSSVVQLQKLVGSGWDSVECQEVTYLDDLISNVVYSFEEGNKSPYYRLDIILNNDLIVEFSEFWQFAYAWRKYTKTTIDYESDKILSWDFYYDVENNGLLHTYDRGEYTYENGILTKMMVKDTYSTIGYYYYEDFIYDGDVISQCKCFAFLDNDWFNFVNLDYQYGNNDLLNYVELSIYNDEWIVDSYISYVYDNEGNLITEEDDEGYVYSYFYEEGSGNANLLWTSPIDKVYGFPDIKNPENKKQTTIHNIRNRIPRK